MADLRYKEVVNICTGCRLGYVNDVVLETASGQILALVVPGRYRFFGLFGREEDYLIPWQNVQRIGDDIILIEIAGEYEREKWAKPY